MNLTQKLVREMFDYNAETGVLTWRERPREHFATEAGWKRTNSQFAGQEAGTTTEGGYRAIGIGGRYYKTHRLIWLHVHGYMPDEVDHENGIGTDNRLTNLRATDHFGNMKNKRIYANNTSGHPGVIWEKTKGLWVATIQVNGRPKKLGRSKDKAKAIAMRHAAEREYGYHSNHGRAA